MASEENDIKKTVVAEDTDDDSCDGADFDDPAKQEKPKGEAVGTVTDSGTPAAATSADAGLGPIVQVISQVARKYNFADRASEQLLGLLGVAAARKPGDKEPGDDDAMDAADDDDDDGDVPAAAGKKGDGKDKPGQPAAKPGLAVVALKELDTAFEVAAVGRNEAYEKLKVTDRPGSAIEKTLLDIEWQKQIVDTLGNMGKEQSKLDTSDKPVDLKVVQEKVAAGKINELTRNELVAAIKQEAVDGKFGPASQYGLKLSVDWHNQVVLDTNKDLIASGLRLNAGGPIPSYTELSDVKTEFGTSFGAYKAKMLSDKTDLVEIQRMVKDGMLKTDLFFDPKERPSLDQLRAFTDGKHWLETSQARLAENNHKLEANRRWRVFSEILGIKDTGWQPPENPKESMRYCQRADDVSNLMFRMRNNAEAINSLKQIDGDFKTEALSKFPGTIEWTGNPPKIAKMNLDLPDSLAVTPENERKLQKLRDWLDTYGPGVERALDEYRTGNFARYGDFVEKGVVGKDDKGTVLVKDESGSVRAVVMRAGTEIEVLGNDKKPHKITLTEDTNLFRNLDGQFRLNGQVVLTELKPKTTSTSPYDYICDKFGVKTDAKTGEIIVTMDRSLEKDHSLNYKRWFGDQVGTMNGEKRYKPDDLVAIQTSSGKLQLIRADRLQEFLDVQAIMHHGGKIVDTALDVGMCIGFGQAGFAIKAGRYLYAGACAVRGMLGVGGLLDPAFRQMGETGETIRQARHYAILLDVTQGLLRKGAGAAFGAKFLMETKGVAEVHRLMEASKWMSRATSASTKVFGACDAYYLPVMGHEIYEKGRARMGYDPRARLEEARKAIGDGRGDSTAIKVTPRPDAKTQAEAIATMLTTYEKMLGLTDPGQKGKVGERFEKVRQGLTDAAGGVAYRNQELTKMFLPSEEQLKDLKAANPKRLLPRDLQGKLELTGTEEEKVAAAMGLLYLSRDKDGKLPEDGVLARRDDVIPAFPYTEYDSEGHPHEFIEPAQKITQKVELKEVLSTLQHAALNSERPETRMVAADALFRLGAMSSGQYASLALEYLEKDATTDTNRDFRVKVMRQVADLIELSKFEQAHETSPAGDQYGASAEALQRRLQEVSASEKDPDARAMAMAILHARNFSEKDLTPEQIDAKYQEGVDKLFKKYDELKGKGKAFHDDIIDGFKKELNAELPDPSKDPKVTKADVEAAIEARLRAVQAFRNFEGSPLEADTFKAIDINARLNECIEATGTDQLHTKADRLSLPLTIRIIDSIMARKDTLTQEQSKNVARTALGIMEIPYPANGVGRTEPALAKLAVIARMGQIFDGNPIHQKTMIDSLKKMIDPDSDAFGPRKGWGQFPEMRAASINMMAQLGTTDKATIDLIAARLQYNPDVKGADAFFVEPIPQVRAASINALARLSEHRFQYTAAEIKELEKKDPDIRKNLGLDPALHVEELLKHERDPVALDSLWRIWERGHRLDPQSAEYKQLYDRAIERLDSASMITFTRADALAFVNSKPNLKLLDPTVLAGEVKRRSEELRNDPYAGFLGWCDKVISSNKTIRDANEEATASATATAFTDKRKERQDAFTELINFTNMSNEDQQNAIKTLMHIIRHPDGGLFPASDTQTALARIRASELLLRLCAFEGTRDIVGHKELLSKAVTSCLLQSSIDTNSQCKYNLVKCVDALTIKDPTKINTGKGTDAWLISPERAALIYNKALERETSQKFDTDRNRRDRTESRALQLHMIERLYDLRANGAAPSLDAIGRPGGDWEKYLPDVAKYARDTLQAMRYGVTHLLRDAVPDKHSDLATRADFIKFGLQDSKFNYEGACTAMFRACKDLPIKDRSDSRVEELIPALTHPNERVRLTAAIILADSKVDAHFMTAVDALANIAVNGTSPRTQADAQAMLKDMITRGQPAEQDIAFRAWQTKFDERKALPPDKQPPNIPPAVPPPPIANPEALGTRKVPVADLDLMLRTGRDPITFEERDRIRNERIANVAKMLGRSEESIRADIAAETGRFRRDLFPTDGGPRKKMSDEELRKWIAGLGDAKPDFAPQRPVADDLIDQNARRMIMQPTMYCARHHDKPKDPPFDPRAFDFLRPKTDLESLEALAGVYPFAIEAMSRGVPEAGRPVWGQVRHRDAAALETAKLEQRNASLATDWLDQRLRTAENPQQIIAALKDSCTRTPLTSPEDRRISRVMTLLKDKDESVRMECAAIVLRGAKDNFVNKGFTPEQRAEAYAALNANAASLLKKGSEKDAAALTLLDRALEAPKNEQSLRLSIDHVTNRGANWADVSKLVHKNMSATYSYESAPGVTREVRKIPEGLAIGERNAAGELLRVVTPDGVKYGDLLAGDLKVPGKGAVEQLAIAKNLLTGKAEIQASDANKQVALDAVGKIAADSTVDSKLRMQAVSMILAEKQATAVHKQNAIAGCIAVSRVAGPQQAEARAMLAQFDKDTALWAIPQLVQSIKTDGTEAGKKGGLDTLFKLSEKWKSEPATIDAMGQIATDNTLDAQPRLQAITAILAEKDATAVQKQTAMAGCIALARMEGPHKPEARAMLAKFDKETAMWAIPQLVKTIKADVTEPEKQERLEMLAVLADKWKADPAVEAAVYDVFAAAHKLNDAALMQRLNAIVDRSDDKHSLSPITSKDDPRLKVMADVIATPGSHPMALNAALAFLDAKSTAVSDSQRVEARKQVLMVVKDELSSLRAQEANGDAQKLLPQWNAVDKLLQRLGAGPEDYSRLYIQSRVMEAKGDFKGLVPVYEKLAKMSEERESAEGARIYKAKALEAKIKSGDAPQLAAASKDFTDALAAAELLRKSGGAADAVAKAEEKLNAAAKTFDATIGTASEAAADAYLKVAAYYKAAGMAEKAAEFTQYGSEILQDISRQRVAHLDPAINWRAPDPKADTSKVPMVKRLSTGNEYTSDVKIDLNSNDVLKDVVDYQISKTTVGEAATADARRIATKALDEQIAAFGPNSPQAVRANEAFGDFLRTSRQGFEATKFYEAALRTSEMQLNPATGAQHSALVAKLAKQAIDTGGPDGFVKAVDMVESTIKKMLDSGMDPAMVATQMDNLSMQFHQRDMGTANDLARRANALRTGGQLPPPQTGGTHYELYKRMNGGGNGPGGPPAGNPG